MKSGVKTILVTIIILVIFACLILVKWYLSSDQYLKKNKKPVKEASIQLLQGNIKADSLYEVKDVLYKDSAILIAVANPEKSGTDIYFNKKYNLNDYDNINMVYVYLYDSTKSLGSVSFDDALMATGKKLGRFQEQWASAYIDTADKSCKPLKKYLQLKMKYPESFKNEETIYQPASIHKMQVVCKYRSKDSTGNPRLNEITALIGSDGTVISTQ